jgi:hypothetical protein
MADTVPGKIVPAQAQVAGIKQNGRIMQFYRALTTRVRTICTPIRKSRAERVARNRKSGRLYFPSLGW